MPELIAPPVSSQADDEVDLLSSSTVSAALRNIDSSDDHRLDAEPFLLPFLLFPLPVVFIGVVGVVVVVVAVVRSFTGLVWVDVVLQTPILLFVMVMSSRSSSSIFNTGKLLFVSSDDGKLNCVEYFFSRPIDCFRLTLAIDVGASLRSDGVSRLNDCNGMYVCEKIDEKKW